MNPLFYLVLFILILGMGGSLFGFYEWAYHNFKYKTILLWSLGLLCLNWYQAPTLIALSGHRVVLTDFNFLISLGLPIAFLGFGLIYLGSLSMTSRIKPSTALVFLGWFVAALIFYGFYYRDNMPFQNAWPVIGSNLLFFAPIFIVNLTIAVNTYRKATRLNILSLKTGLWAYIIASCLGLVRCGLSLFFGLRYPPAFAALRFLSPPFIAAQAAGLGFFLLSFFLLHKNIERLSRLKSGSE